MMKVIGRWTLTLGLAACLATACKKEEPATSAPTKTPPAAEPTDAGAVAGAGSSQTLQPEEPKNPDWTAGRLAVQRSTLQPVTLREVRAARNEGFDRVVFQFDGQQVPGYHIEYVDKPVIKCGSGDPTPVAGQGWLQVRIVPAQAHEDGKPTVTERERKPALPVLEELEQTCDFEAEVTWVLGVKHPNTYRVLELSGPSRLVVDVRH